jgi:hypothetical protein
MIFKRLSPFLFLFISLSVAGQISLKTPRICHDKDGYLTCFFEGSYQMQFNKGNFRCLTSIDSDFVYNDSDKTITYYPLYPSSKVPVHLQLLPHSILIIQGSKTTKLDTLPKIPSPLHDFNIGTYDVNPGGQGLLLSTAGGREVELEIWTFKEGWEWKPVVRKEKQTLVIVYNAFRKNRLESLMLMDDSLRRGMALSTTFRSLKKLWMLRSVYYYTDTAKNIATMDIPVDNHYSYLYKKNGKLKRSIGDVSICDCKVF